MIPLTVAGPKKDPRLFLRSDQIAAVIPDIFDDGSKGVRIYLNGNGSARFDVRESAEEILGLIGGML